MRFKPKKLQFENAHGVIELNKNGLAIISNNVIVDNFDNVLEIREFGSYAPEYRQERLLYSLIPDFSNRHNIEWLSSYDGFWSWSDPCLHTVRQRLQIGGIQIVHNTTDCLIEAYLRIQYADALARDFGKRKCDYRYVCWEDMPRHRQVKLLNDALNYETHKQHRSLDDFADLQREIYQMRADIMRVCNISQSQADIVLLEKHTSSPNNIDIDDLATIIKRAKKHGIKSSYSVSLLNLCSDYRDYLTDLDDPKTKTHLKKLAERLDVDVTRPTRYSINILHAEANRWHNAKMRAGDYTAPQSWYDDAAIKQINRWIKNIKLLDTRHKMRAEGKKQGHCIGRSDMGYVDKCAQSRAIAFHYDGTTVYRCGDDVQASDRFNTQPSSDRVEYVNRLSKIIYNKLVG